MPRKKKIMDSVVFNNGGSKTMIKPDERAKIRRLVLDEHRLSSDTVIDPQNELTPTNATH